MIHDKIVRERGVTHLGMPTTKSHRERCAFHIEKDATVEAIDIIEVAFQVVEEFVEPKNYYDKVEAAAVITRTSVAIEELNHRFKEHSIGYQYEHGQIVPLNSEYLHSEAVIPTLRLLGDKKFKGAEEEFLKAHRLYREGNNKDAVANALKAFESTMKAICDARSWTYDPAKSTANELIRILFDNELMPSYLQSHFTGVRTTLEAGLPTLRNRTSGHGQGVVPVEVPNYLAAYALHLAASNIVLLVEAHKAKV